MLSKSQRRFHFAVWVVVLTGVWCCALPRLAQWKPLRQHIDAMQAKNIHVDAMFYTELDWQPPTGAAWR